MHATIEKLRFLAIDTDQLDALFAEARGIAQVLDDDTFFAGGVVEAIDKSRHELSQIQDRLLKAVALAEKELAEQQQEVTPCLICD